MGAEQLAYSAFVAGFGLTAIASVCYLALPLWPRVAYSGAATEAGPTMTVAGATSGAPALLAPAATASTWLAVLALTASLGARWAAAGRPPFANMWEYTVGFGWGIALFYVLFEWRYGQRTLGAFVMPMAVALFAVSIAFFPSQVRPLIPALQANRLLAAHVGTTMLAYAALAISFAAALMYLAQGEQRRFSRLPSAEVLEDIGYKSVLVGFPMLAVGIGLGAYWANSAWGRYWGWDPKETAMLVTALVYAVYLHARLTWGARDPGWRGGLVAWLSVFGYLAVLYAWIGINYFVASLHSFV